ncbi:MAG: tetratricopeptide repeat protein [Sulfuriferula sp.]
MNNYNYMLSHASPGFWMRPEIHTQKGRLLAATKSYAEAVSEIEQALKGNPNYAPAYAALSDIYADLGQKSKSVAALEQGLQHAPDTVSLQRRYKQLTGKTFVPPSGAKQAAPPPKSPGAATATPAQQDAPTSSAVPENAAPAAASAPTDTPEKIGVPGNPYCRFCP